MIVFYFLTSYIIRVFNVVMYNPVDKNIELLSTVGIVTIYRKNKEWFVHLQRKDNFGFLTTGESVWGENLEETLNLLVAKVN